MFASYCFECYFWLIDLSLVDFDFHVCGFVCSLCVCVSWIVCFGFFWYVYEKGKEESWSWVGKNVERIWKEELGKGTTLSEYVV